MTFFFTLQPNLSADILARCVAQKWSPHLQKISAFTQKFKSLNLTWKNSPLIPNNIKDSKFKNLRKSRNKRITEPNTWDQRYQNPINLVGYSQSKPIKTFHMSKVGFNFFLRYQQTILNRANFPWGATKTPKHLFFWFFFGLARGQKMESGVI